MTKKLELERNFLGLEVLRFICSLAVLFWHYRHFFYIDHSKIISGIQLNAVPFYHFFRLFYDHGHFAVRVFWLISGFIFFWKYALEVSTKKISFHRFSILRLSRLYPLHLITLIVVALLQYKFFHDHNYYFVSPHNDIKHFILNLFFASSWGFFEKGYSFNVPIWSVSVEILVYLFFFKILGSLKLSIKNVIKTILVFFLLYRFKVHAEDIFECAALFFYGGLIYMFYDSRKEWFQKNLVLLSLILSLLSISIFHFIDFGTITLTLGHYFTKTGFLFIKYFIYLPIIFFSFLLLFEIPRMNAVVKKISWLANLTYSSYLIHFPVQIIFVLMADYFGYGRQVFLTPEMFLLFFGVTLGASHLTFKWVEVPLQRYFRRKFLAKNIATIAHFPEQKHVAPEEGDGPGEIRKKIGKV